MTVVGAGSPIVFCEGGPGSVDIRLVSLLVESPAVLVVPAHGKRGIRAFAQGYRASESHDTSHIIFRDRDFDAEPESDQALLECRGHMYLTGRACVESYMLDARLLFDYGSQVGHAALGESVEGVDSLLTKCAEAIADYQAVRWALARLKPRDGWPEIRSTWTDGDGSLPEDLSLPSCRRNAAERVKCYRDRQSGISEDQLDCAIGEFYERFTAESFWEQNGWQLWFHGKDLLKSLNRKLGAGSLSTSDLAWALEQGRLRIDDHPDLVQLRGIIRDMTAHQK